MILWLQVRLWKEFMLNVLMHIILPIYIVFVLLVKQERLTLIRIILFVTVFRFGILD